MQAGKGKEGRKEAGGEVNVFIYADTRKGKEEKNK